MSIYPPPSQTGLIFDLDNWEQIVDTSGGVSTSFLDERYLRYTTAQGNETFSNTINTGYSDVDGSTICNTLDTYSYPATTSLFDTTDKSTQAIRLGMNQVSGVINLGRQYDGLATYNTNQIGGWTSIGRQIVGDSRPELNYSDATSDTFIGGSQTTGELYLASNANRSGVIYFGSNASSSVSHNIGASGSTVNISGNNVNIINETSTLKQNNATLYMTDNASVLYSLVYNELNVVNASTSTKTLTLPTTIRDFTFWVTTRTNDLIISSPSKLIDFGCDATNSLTIKAGSNACIVACVGSDSFNLIYSNLQMYQPIRLYPNATAYSPLSTQSGYVFYTAGVNASKTAGQTTATSLNLTSTALPKGIYYINVYGYITITSVTNPAILALTRPFFVGCVSTTLNQSTVVNNIADSRFNNDFITPVNGAIITQLGVGGYYNNATTGTILYGYGRIDGGTSNSNTGYRVNLEMNIRRIY
jgi:hypothetical protein